MYSPILKKVTKDAAGKNDQQIANLIHATQHLPLEKRIDKLSGYFVKGKTYEFTLGEGSDSRFDQQPLYRLDAIDCTTYIEMVLGMTLADNLDQFKTIIKKIRYHDGEVNFINRNHFTGEDWIPNNIKNGYIRDITAEVAGSNNTATISVYINKKNWYKNLTSNRIRIANLSAEQKNIRLAELKEEGQHTQNIYSKLTYIPLTKLFLANDKVNTAIINRIPDGTIIVIVRKNYPDIRQFGTHWSVSHMSFAIWKNQRLYLRMASSIFKQTVDLPMIGYLESYLGNSTVIGIGVYQIIKKD